MELERHWNEYRESFRKTALPGAEVFFKKQSQGDRDLLTYIQEAKAKIREAIANNNFDLYKKCMVLHQRASIKGFEAMVTEELTNAYEGEDALRALLNHGGWVWFRYGMGALHFGEGFREVYLVPNFHRFDDNPKGIYFDAEEWAWLQDKDPPHVHRAVELKQANPGLKFFIGLQKFHLRSIWEYNKESVADWMLELFP